MEQEQLSCIEVMPNEILYKIFHDDVLDISDIYHLSQVNNRFHGQTYETLYDEKKKHEDRLEEVFEIADEVYRYLNTPLIMANTVFATTEYDRNETIKFVEIIDQLQIFDVCLMQRLLDYFEDEDFEIRIRLKIEKSKKGVVIVSVIKDDEVVNNIKFRQNLRVREFIHLLEQVVYHEIDILQRQENALEIVPSYVTLV